MSSLLQPSSAAQAHTHSPQTTPPPPAARPPRSSPAAPTPLRLRRARKHHLLPHPHRLHRRPRLLPPQLPRQRLLKKCISHRHRMRHLHRRRSQPSNRRQPIKNLLQRQILPTQNVPLPRRPRSSATKCIRAISSTSTRFNPVSTYAGSSHSESPRRSARRRRLRIERPNRRRRIQNHHLLPTARRLHRDCSAIHFDRL